MTCVGYEYEASAAVVLAAVEDGFTHSVDILLALVLALTHVYARYHLLPAGLFVHLGQFLLVDGFLSQVFLGPLAFLLLLALEVLLQLAIALGLTRFLVAVLTVLRGGIVTLLSLRRAWMRSSSSRMRLVASSSSKSLKPSSSCAGSTCEAE